MRHSWLILAGMALMALAGGCDRSEQGKDAGGGAGAAPATAALQQVTINLNWVPEPEFGGIYAAQLNGGFSRRGIEAKVVPGGAGAPTWQLVDTGRADFAVASADEVLVARSRGADVVALFATYQTCPQGIMVHASRGLKTLADVFSGGTLAVEPGLPYVKFLEKKYGFGRVKLVTYSGGIAEFLASADYAQQCFVTSEPLVAKRQGADAQVFLVADSGYNPYTAVVIARGSYVKDHPQTVRAVREALAEGWQAYLADPAPANQMMGKLNPGMDAATFAAAAEAQKPLIAPAPDSGQVPGAMTRERWRTLAQQLRELNVIDKDVPAEQCMASP